MASVDGRRALQALRCAIPLPRDPAEQARIVADDELIESIRVGQLANDDDDPLLRLLTAWRCEAVDGT